MTTSTLDVGDLFSILGARGIERQLRRVGGAGRVSVNPVSGSTTVDYDPGRTSLPVLQAAIEQCGFHCSGEALPERICEPHAPPDRGVVAMRADWTRPDPAMTAYLQSFGRYGVPLDVGCGPGAPDGVALSELLTQQSTMDALGRAAAPAPGATVQATPW